MGWDGVTYLHKAAEYEKWAERARSCGRYDLAILYEIKAKEWFTVYKEWGEWGNMPLGNRLWMKTTEELKDIVKSYMEKAGATYIFMPPVDTEGNKTEDCDEIAIFLKLNVLFYIHVRSQADYTDAWALEQVLCYSEQYENSFNDGMTNIGWVITTANKFEKREIYEEANKRHVRLINGDEFKKMLEDVGIEYD